MMSTFLATPDNWFDLPPRVAACAEAGASLELTLTDSDGRRPLADVALDELRAVHQTFGSWWYTLGGDTRPASLRAGAYDCFLTDSRALLKEKAEAVLAAPTGLKTSALALVTLPPLDHGLLTDPQGALAFFKSFLAVPHSPSLVAWARAPSSTDPAVMSGATHAWLRVVLQKVAVEDDLAEALVCLRAVYGTDDAARRELLRQESELLEQCGLEYLLAWAESLGLYRPMRTQPAFNVPRRGTPRNDPDPDLTVLVPSYCHAEFIEATLESVLAQTYSPLRLLMVDDHSPDCTVDRAARIHDPRLQIEVNETNLGLGDSVLRALGTIATPYIALLNSDDLFHPERLERCRDVLERSPQAQIVATNIVPIGADGRQLTVDNVNRLFDGQQIADWIQWFSAAGRLGESADLVAELMERNFLITSSNIVCRTEFLRSRANSLRGLKYCFDWQLFLEAAVDRTLVHVPEQLLGYRLHGSNTVWFDEDRRAAYALEVNRVLARTLRQLLQPSSSRPDAGDLAEILELLANHAAKHSEANGFALYASELLGSRRLEEARDRSRAVRNYLHSMSHPDGTSAVADVGGYGTGATSSARRQEAIANAARAIADAAQEEATVARGSERWLREELHRHQEELARLRTSPEWLVGDRLWNRAGLSQIGRPASRAVRWLRDFRDRWRSVAPRGGPR